MKFTSIALLAFTTLGLVDADNSLNRSGGSRLARRAEVYPQLNRNGISINPLESLEKRASVCPAGDFACSDGNGCCPIGSSCVPNTLKCSVACGASDVKCADGGCCSIGTYCGGDGYCYKGTGSGNVGNPTTTSIHVVAPTTTTSLYVFPSTSVVAVSSLSPGTTSIAADTTTLPPPAISKPTSLGSASGIATVPTNPVAALSGAIAKTVSAASVVLVAIVVLAQL
ncbi:hypothetical protein BC943DRAFT_321809 [Umbelopsis sp. AD052]|nr:hypothetical protein BC943DRAFT_321809 [Umbelopsis sp. AD052]